MKSNVLQDGIIKANSIEEVLTGATCPFCHATKTEMPGHLMGCEEYANFGGPDAECGWAVHYAYGKVLVLNIADGLCLFESPEGRFVSTTASFQFGTISETISHLENADLSDEEIDTVINMLRLKRKEFGSLSEYPKLWKGCKVDIVAGDNVHQATVSKFLNPGYMVVLESGLEISVQPKHIIRIV